LWKREKNKRGQDTKGIHIERHKKSKKKTGISPRLRAARRRVTLKGRVVEQGEEVLKINSA